MWDNVNDPKKHIFTPWHYWFPHENPDYSQPESPILEEFFTKNVLEVNWTNWWIDLAEGIVTEKKHWWAKLAGKKL